MNKSKRNTKSPNNSPAAPNKPSQPKNQAGCYAEAWKLCFSKLSKEAQADLLINLRKPTAQVRGKDVWPQDVKCFVNAVAEVGETIFEALEKAGSIKVA